MRPNQLVVLLTCWTVNAHADTPYGRYELTEGGPSLTLHRSNGDPVPSCGRDVVTFLADNSRLVILFTRDRIKVNGSDWIRQRDPPATDTVGVYREDLLKGAIVSIRFHRLGGEGAGSIAAIKLRNGEQICGDVLSLTGKFSKPNPKR